MDILKVFTPEQLRDLMRDKIVSDNVGLTNFNVGSRINSIIEAVAICESTTGFDYLEGLRRAIPIALYDGLNFGRKEATVSNGYLRFYRLPEFFLTYTGAGTSCKLTITNTELSTIVTGAGGDDLTLDFTTYTTIASLVSAIASHGSYNATLVGTGLSSGSNLYHYVSAEIKGAKNYRELDGFDVLFTSATAVTVPAGSQAQINESIFITTVAGSVSAGSSSSNALSAACLETGTDGNIDANEIDTLNGKGILLSGPTELNHVINDSAFANGGNEESDDERSRRFQDYIQGLNGQTSRGIQSAVSQINGIRSVTVRDNYPGAGQITVVADDGTGNLPSELIPEIEKILDGDPDDLENYPGVVAAGIIWNIDSPVVIDVNITINVFRIGETSDEDEIKIAVKTILEQYVNTRRLGDDIVLNEMKARAMRSHPAIYDIAISIPTANISISDSELARTGSGTGGTVTVTLTTLTESP